MGETAEAVPEARVQDVFVLALGVMIFTAPLFNGDSVHPHGTMITQSTGAAICAVALWGIGRPSHAIVPFLAFVAGLALMCAPLYTRGVPLHYAECIVAGAIACGLATSAVIESRRRDRRTIR